MTTVSIYTLATINGILSTWLNISLTIATIFGVLLLADKILYRIGIDALELVQRWQAAKYDYERKQLSIAQARLDLRDNRQRLLAYLEGGDQ